MAGIGEWAVHVDSALAVDSMLVGLTATGTLIGHTSMVNHNTIVYQYRFMSHNVIVVYISALYTFSHTVSTNTH